MRHNSYTSQSVALAPTTCKQVLSGLPTYKPTDGDEEIGTAVVLIHGQQAAADPGKLPGRGPFLNISYHHLEGRLRETRSAQNNRTSEDSDSKTEIETPSLQKCALFPRDVRLSMRMRTTLAYVPSRARSQTPHVWERS